MNTDIQIYQKNHATIVVQASARISKELSHFMSAMAPNFRFMPLYKQGIWDGRLRFLNGENELGIGLIEKVYEFARLGKYTIECKFERFNTIAMSDFSKFIEMLKLPFDIRDYQFNSAYEALTKKNVNIHISTAGGKSAVIYALVRFLTLQEKKILLICPTTQLVEQMFGDFVSYGWDAERYCHRIYSGQRKIFDAPVTISTWQTLSKIKDKKLFTEWDCIICDEAQGVKGNEIQKISKLCTNAEYRFGFSGTYPEKDTAEWFAIVGALGPIQTFATYKTLQKEGHIAGIKIFTVKLKYDKDFKIKVYKEGERDYQHENDVIYANNNRSLFLCKMVQNLKENTLVLFQKREKHGHVLRQYFEANLKGKQILYIDGTIDVLDRDEYRKLLEKHTNIVLLATYATLSAGVNIKNLHNIILASSYKSKIKILQSIGRGLRKHKSKTHLKLYDIVDDVSFRANIQGKNTIFINYSLRHAKERQKYYQEQGWECKEIHFNI